jgi:hypothetical protein
MVIMPTGYKVQGRGIQMNPMRWQTKPYWNKAISPDKQATSTLCLWDKIELDIHLEAEPVAQYCQNLHGFLIH